MLAPKRAAFYRLFEAELRAWYGLLPLWKVFWGYGVAASWVLIGLYVMAVSEDQTNVQQCLLVLFGAYTVWVLVSVWRCAAASDPHWQLLARLLTVAWAVNAAMMIVFLQLELLIIRLGS